MGTTSRVTKSTLQQHRAVIASQNAVTIKSVFVNQPVFFYPNNISISLLIFQFFQFSWTFPTFKVIITVSYSILNKKCIVSYSPKNSSQSKLTKTGHFQNIPSQRTTFTKISHFAKLLIQNLTVFQRKPTVLSLALPVLWKRDYQVSRIFCVL